MQIFVLNSKIEIPIEGTQIYLPAAKFDPLVLANKKMKDIVQRIANSVLIMQEQDLAHH